MKIRIDMTIRAAPEATSDLERFRRIKKRIKAMSQGDLAVLILDSVERNLDRTIGFRPNTR